MQPHRSVSVPEVPVARVSRGASVAVGQWPYHPNSNAKVEGEGEAGIWLVGQALILTVLLAWANSAWLLA